MKKTLAAAVAALTLACAAFCEKLEVPVDVYDDGTAAAQEQKDDLDARRAKKEQKEQKAKQETKIKWNTKANREAAMAGDPYNKKKMVGIRNFGERLLNINKFTKIEPFSAYLRPTVGPLFVRKGHLIYREGTDIAGLMMYYDSSAYALQFAQDARRIAVNAIDCYFKDFDEKRLDRSAKAKKTRQAYGFCEGYEDFGIVSGMMTNYSRPKVFFGYMFIKNTPYFTIDVRQAKNLAVNEKTEEGSLKANVIEQIYYLTKSQAKKLAVFLSDANVSALQSASTMDDSAEVLDSYDAEPQAEQEPVKAEPEPAPEAPAKAEPEPSPEPAKAGPKAE